MSNLSIQAQQHNTWQLCSWFHGSLLPLPCVTSIFHAISKSRKDQILRYRTHLFNSFHFCTIRKQRKENVINRTIVCWPAVLLKQKSEFQKSVSPDVKTYYKNPSEEPAWCQLKTEYIDQWKRIERPEIDRHRNSQLSLTKEERQITGDCTVFSVSVARTIRCAFITEKSRRRPYSLHRTKSNQITYLSIKV